MHPSVQKQNDWLWVGHFMYGISWGIKVRVGYNEECIILDCEGWGRPLFRRSNMGQ